MADETNQIKIRVTIPKATLQKAFALDLPMKVKSKVLSSIIKEAIRGEKPNPIPEWEETWGETPPPDEPINDATG
jgi:hypothetical protein